MKVTQQLEWDYASKQKDDGSFMTKNTIKNLVAAELFIPVVKQLYDNNIFTCWSGLSGDAHIRIPMDGLSKENYLIAKENCKKGKNWKLLKPFYVDLEDIIPNYTFEISIPYGENTEVEEVMKKLSAEANKLKFQDVQIAKTNFARQSMLPRVGLEGLYKKSRQTIYTRSGEKEIEAESLEELMEMFCEGENPRYYYDKKTNTFFRNTELISKSREFEAFCEIKEKMKAGMSDQEKYKTIFDWIVDNFDYAYSGLYYAYAEALTREERDKKLTKFFRIYGKKKSQVGILNLEHRRNFLEAFPELPEVPEEEKEYTRRIVEFLEQSEECKKSEGIGYKDENSWLSKNGVCLNFALIYESLCKKFDLPCRSVLGWIDSREFKVGHAWNAIMVKGKIKYVDISSAIHCKDGTDKNHKIEDFFGKSFGELKEIDNGRNRKIFDNSKKEIKEMIEETPGFDY